MKQTKLVLFILIIIFSGCGNDPETQKQRFLIRGNNALSEQNYREAIRFYTEALNIDSCYSPAWNNLGVTRFEQKQYGGALEAYNAALLCNPDDKEAILNRTNAYYETNQLYRAEDDLLYLIRELPDSSDLYFRLGLVHARMHRFAPAVDDFNNALRLNPENTEALINRGTVYYYMNELSKARDDLYRAQKTGVQMGNVYNGLALVAAESDSLDLAMSYIGRALTEEPLQPYFLNNRGYLHLLRGEYEMAEEDINRSITLDPENAWAYRNKARFYHLQGDYEEAIRLYELALEKNTFIQKINVFLGDSYLASGNIVRACELYREGANRNEAGAGERLVENGCDKTGK